MQLAATEVLDLSKKTEAHQEALRPGQSGDRQLWHSLLDGAATVESGVRLRAVFVGKGQPWDLIMNRSNKRCPRSVLRATSLVLLIKDLKSRGLLDSTVSCGPASLEDCQPRKTPADATTIERLQPLVCRWRIQERLGFGRTDDFGYKAIENRVSVPNLQATLFHLLGLGLKAHLPARGREETPTEFSITGATVVGDLLKRLRRWREGNRAPLLNEEDAATARLWRGWCLDSGDVVGRHSDRTRQQPLAAASPAGRRLSKSCLSRHHMLWFGHRRSISEWTTTPSPVHGDKLANTRSIAKVG
jgi:hypothetical protein